MVPLRLAAGTGGAALARHRSTCLRVARVQELTRLASVSMTSFHIHYSLPFVPPFARSDFSPLFLPWVFPSLASLSLPRSLFLLSCLPSFHPRFSFPLPFLVSVWSSFYARSLSLDVHFSSPLSQVWRLRVCPVLSLSCISNLCVPTAPMSTATTSPDGHIAAFVPLEYFCGLLYWTI